MIYGIYTTPLHSILNHNVHISIVFLCSVMRAGIILPSLYIVYIQYLESTSSDIHGLITEIPWLDVAHVIFPAHIITCNNIWLRNNLKEQRS